MLFPDPAIPVTRTRRPIPTAASLIDCQCPSGNSLRRPVVGTNRARNSGLPEASYAGTGWVSVSLIRFASIVMPGPMVLAIVRLLMYLPLAALGFARSSSSTTAR